VPRIRPWITVQISLEFNSIEYSLLISRAVTNSLGQPHFVSPRRTRAESIIAP
jgi:hypothetical protein